MKLKTFESFEIDNSKEWIIGVPSGEAFHIPRDLLNILYNEKLITFTTGYNQIGLFIFNDDLRFIIIEKIKDFDKNSKPKNSKPKKKIDHDIRIFDHNFEEIVINTILNLIGNYDQEVVELYVQDDTLGITYGEFYIEINIISPYGSSKYQLIKRENGIIKDKYNIPTDSGLIKRISSEME